MLLFGGLIRTNSILLTQAPSNTLYYLMNFNDLGSAMVTLFQIMIINNWQVTCGMYVEATGANWPRVYFAAFWLVTVCFILTIVTSFVLDIYGSVNDDVENEWKKRIYI